jgi:hypothetical protein
MTYFRPFASLACISLLLASCATSPTNDSRDTVSVGGAKLFLKVGETSQTQVLEAFGGPNIVAGDAAEGDETWTYDRMSYVSSSTDAGGTAGGVGFGGSGGGGGLLWGHTSSSSVSSRTATLFLYWKNGALVNFKYRSASF